jgi:hypothetical protein
MQMAKAVIIWGAMALLPFAAPLSAQDNVREACMADIHQFCSAELASFSREKVRACLVKNIKKTSPGCQAAAKARRDAERAKKKGS